MLRRFEPFTTGWWEDAPDIPGLLALGSGLLLMGAVLLVSTGLGFVSSPSIYLPLFSGVAVAVHAVAWVQLRRASEVSPAMRWLFRASVLGFVAGPIVWATLQTPVGLVNGWVYLVYLAPLIPFLPFVFAPVVICHALIFLTPLQSMRNPWAKWAVVAGGAFLVVDALLSFTANPWSLNPPWFTLYSGATVFGYLAVYAGWSWERKAVAGVWNPAPRDRGAAF